MREAFAAGFDGTQLCYRVYGRGARWLVIANGYGATFEAWDGVLEHLIDDFKILIWDYRGLFRSAVPVRRAHLDIEHHVADLEILLDLEGVERCTLIGWSVGVQVALEGWRRLGPRIERLVLVNGAHDRVLSRLLGRTPTGRWLSAALAVAGRTAPLVTPVLRPVLRRAARSRVTLPVLSRLGVVRGQPAGFQGAVQGIIEINLPIYLHMARRADRHATEAWLHTVSVPTLVTAGTHDALTPAHISARAVARLPQAQFVSFPGGTHYAVMEFPGMLAGHIREFCGVAGVTLGGDPAP